MTLQLSAQLETALIAEAVRRGMTPDALASEMILSQLPNSAVCDVERTRSAAATEPSPGTMLDKWRAHLDSLPMPLPGTPPTSYSQDTGRKFAEAMVEKRRQGHL
jgi:hypothetical protein